MYTGDLVIQRAPAHFGRVSDKYIFISDTSGSAICCFVKVLWTDTYIHTQTYYHMLLGSAHRRIITFKFTDPEQAM